MNLEEYGYSIMVKLWSFKDKGPPRIYHGVNKIEDIPIINFKDIMWFAFMKDGKEIAGAKQTDVDTYITYTGNDGSFQKKYFDPDTESLPSLIQSLPPWIWN